MAMPDVHVGVVDARVVQILPPFLHLRLLLHDALPDHHLPSLAPLLPPNAGANRARTTAGRASELCHTRPKLSPLKRLS